MITRIQKIIQLKKLTSSAFADKIGVPKSTISHILSGRNNPSLEFVQKVLDSFPEIRTEWLIRGDGHMLKASNTLFPDEDFEAPAMIGSSLEERSEKGPGIAEEKLQDEENGEIPARDPYQQKISQSERDKETTEDAIFTDKDITPVGKISDISNQGKEKTIRVMLFFADGTFTEYLPGRQ